MIRFIVDSTFGLTREFALKHNVEVVSLTVKLEEKEFEEGYSGEWDDFYSQYRGLGSKAIATTSQPSPRAYMDAIDRILQADNDADIIILTIGNRLSGSIGSANIATYQYPDKKIVAIDTGTAALSAKMFLEKMLEFAEKGGSIDDAIEYAEELKDKLCIYFIPATLVELARGGRVNKLMSRLGSVLKIRPVFSFAKNEITVLSKSLGLKLAVSSAVSFVKSDFERIGICYIGDDKNVALLKDKLSAKLGLPDIDVEPVCPVLGAHIGVGTVALAVLKK